MSRSFFFLLACLLGLSAALKQKKPVTIVPPNVATPGQKASAAINGYLAASGERDGAFEDALTALHETAPGTYPAHLINVREKQEASMEALDKADEAVEKASEVASKASDKAEEKYNKKKDEIDGMRQKEDFEKEAKDLKMKMTVP
eukprot:gnl/TRDRNA2_/TRDRNA2_85160_c0_seq4.p2 gnl/TRDRNA2_/TRDRNA2_85160_c0~~gnl/TRDRNA2_/TRDRNA2_85160_c0_seq4.p2  ORF type:complete len:146 (-),score=56.03 gnl/TRDRNA2_/TRDRNA2_85160_c0_seq4:111-548(-)